VGPPGENPRRFSRHSALVYETCSRQAQVKTRKNAVEVDAKDVSRFHKVEALATELTRTSLVPTRVGGRARDTIKELGN
jgi:hypothetical protein